MKTIYDLKKDVERTETKINKMLDAYRNCELLEDEIMEFNYLMCAVEKACLELEKLI